MPRTNSQFKVHSIKLFNCFRSGGNQVYFFFLFFDFSRLVCLLPFSFALEFFHACSRGSVNNLLTIPNHRPTNHTVSSTLDLIPSGVTQNTPCCDMLRGCPSWRACLPAAPHRQFMERAVSRQFLTSMTTTLSCTCNPLSCGSHSTVSGPGRAQ